MKKQASKNTRFKALPRPKTKAQLSWLGFFFCCEACLPSSQTQHFYDALAPLYHGIFENWDASMARQAAQIHSLIQKYQKGPNFRILDMTCGIGTQSLGLASLGYRVSASDLSPLSVARARREARQHQLKLRFKTADMLQAGCWPAKHFDVAIMFDNALPHLENTRQITRALSNAFTYLRPGGLFLASIRDYALERREAIQWRPYGQRVINGINLHIFQIWSWQGRHYDLRLCAVGHDQRKKMQLHAIRSRYFAVSLPEMSDCMRQAGFSKIKIFKNAFYQPVILGQKSGGPK